MADPFYRYKVPPLVVKYEGGGNGTKTLITNGTVIARSLKRPIDLFTKYCGYELGSATSVKNGLCTINGWLQQAQLQELMDKFMEAYVLCKECRNPETDVVIKKRLVYLGCKACGYRGAVDPNHKLSNYIVKHGK